MTVSETKSLKIASAIAAPILVALLVGAWSSKEAVADHNRDIDRLNASVQRILDVVCDGKKTLVRACTTP